MGDTISLRLHHHGTAQRTTVQREGIFLVCGRDADIRPSWDPGQLVGAIGRSNCSGQREISFLFEPKYLYSRARYIPPKTSQSLLNPDQTVWVFRNWKRHCYSIMQGGLLCASAREVVLGEVEFIVRNSGRERMLATGRKTVHAFAVAKLIERVHPHAVEQLIVRDGRALIYDANRFETFVNAESLEPITSAQILHLHASGAIYQAWPPSALAA